MSSAHDNHKTVRDTASQYINAIRTEMAEGGSCSPVPIEIEAYLPKVAVARDILMELIDAMGYIEVAMSCLSDVERKEFRKHVIDALAHHASKCARRQLEPLDNTYHFLDSMTSFRYRPSSSYKNKGTV